LTAQAAREVRASIVRYAEIVIAGGPLRQDGHAGGTYD
jgi:hypothetical protein